MTTDQAKESYACQHCGKPTTGRCIGYQGKKRVMEMCKGCEAYIGSEAAQQEGATMKNRFEMERRIKNGRETDKD